MAGYSSTPLNRKLGIRDGIRMHVRNAPDGYFDWIAPLPEHVTIASRLGRNLDMIHVFTRRASELAANIERYKRAIRPDGMIWISWPKQAAKVPTDVTEDVVRRIALPHELVDIKVCAVDAVWSGLKLVIRKSARPPR